MSRGMKRGQPAVPANQDIVQKPDQEALPPRRVKHPSSKQQVTKWFYNSLIFLFMALAAGLFWYGRQMSGQ
ncbi:hypothetical protein PATA110616_01655 [Paenibacillus tarimensis]